MPVMRKSGIDKTCPACGVSFYVQAHRADQAKFCSMKCMWAGRPKRERRQADCTCEQCHQSYRVDAHRKQKTRFCSPRCVALATAGIKRDAALKQIPTGKKKCRRCKIDKPRSEFWERSGAIDGLRGRCKSCCEELHEQWMA